jgi:hypothetical protein
VKKACAVLFSGIILNVLSVGFVFALQPAGKAIVDNACSKCHSVKKVQSANKKAGQWEATLDRMIKKGAKIEPEERALVLQYLNTLNQ